ncbi:MAG TPA: TIGR03905 family TSCPD domain-containing protein [Erysipelotrichaceae bacterium]|nr:TIGR03905 family TSCPD domain-containing protein [Erysipelotrichaceae bacterium]
MAVITFKPFNVCSREMTVEYENGVVTHATVVGGCSGNLQGLCRLIEGMKIKEVISKLENIKCRGSRNGQTSCPDQLAKGLKNANI